MKIEALRLKKVYGNTRALEDVSFSFSSSEIVGFIGPNGAGKTTTMRLMATLDEPTAGDVLFDGISVVEAPERIRSLVGYVPDTLPTHRDMTVRDYLDFFARAYGIRVPRRRTVIETVEEFTGLTELREKFLDALSKGMKQRVSLARSLLHDPEVLIMDEPAAALDPRARIELRELLRTLSAQGKAILISSHILSELAEVCHSTVLIARGRILKTGELNDAGAPAHHTVVIRVKGGIEELCRELAQMPEIDSVRIVGNEVAAEIPGPEEVTGEILTALVRRGFRVLEFRQQRTRLEEMFMRLTKGEGE